jgi:hypothetical protein
MPRSSPDYLIDVHDAAAYASNVTGQPVAAGTVRSWATRRHIGRHGRRGRSTLYDVREIHAYLRPAEARQLDNA